MDDDFDIRTLPTHFVSVKRPSKRLERLKAKRENEHYEALEDMKKKKEKINIVVDGEIKNESEKIKKALELAKMEIEDYIWEWKAKTNLEDLYGTRNPYEVVNKIRTKQLTLIDEFYENLKSIEKERIEKFKPVLKECYSKLLKISHLLPFETEEFFEKELMDINQITLNNFQNYTELQKQLKLQIESNTKQWMENLMEIEEKILELIQSTSLLKIEQLKRSMGSEILKAVSSKDFMSKVELIKSTYSHLFALGDSDSLLPVDENQVKIWLENVQNTVYKLDQSSKNIVEWYKSVIVIIFNRFFDKLEDIRTQLTKNEMIDVSKVEKFQREMYTPTLEDLNLKIQRDFEKLHRVWNKAIQKIDDDIQESHQFLKGTCFLWDNHFERLKQVQLLVSKNVYLAVEKNNQDSNQLQGQTVSILADKVRQASSMKQVNKLYDSCMKLGSSIEKSYYKQYQDELKVAQKYKTFVDNEFDILSLELERFLIIHPPDSDKDPKKQKRRASQISNVVGDDPDEGVVPFQMLYAVFQADATKNWMFGLWESINYYIETGREEVLESADKWVIKQDEKLKKRLNLKIKLLQPRYLRLKYCVYDKRVEELEEHNEKLKCQKLAAEKEIKKIKEMQGRESESYVRIIEKFKNVGNELVKKATNANWSSMVQSSIVQLNNIYTQHSEEMTNVNKNYSNYCNEFFEKLKASNIVYLKSARLFSENGNYTSQEVKGLKKNLAKLEKTVQKQLNVLKSKTVASCKNEQGLLKRKKHEMMAILEYKFSELKYNEYMEKKWKELQKRLENEMAAVRIAKLKIQKNINKLIKDSVNNLSSGEFLTNFGEQSELCFNEIQELVNKLALDEYVDRWTLIEDNPATTEPSHQSSKKAVEMTGVKPPLEENNDFLSIVQSILASFTRDLQEESQAFYNKDPPQSSAKSGNENYMEDILQKMTCFQLQCEKFWLEEKHEFIKNLKELDDFRNTYLETYELNCYEINLDHTKKVVKAILQELKQKEKEVDAELKEMQEKIKVLYGHPNNKKILQTLQNDFNEFLNFSEERIVSCFEPHKITLLKTYEDIKKEIEKVRAELKELSKDDRLSKLVEEIGGEPPKNLPTLQQNSQSKQLNVKSYLSHSTVQTDELLLSSESYESIEEVFKELDDRLNENITQIREFIENNLLQKVRNFKATWTNEIKQVLKLYKVKYDQMASITTIQ